LASRGSLDEQMGKAVSHYSSLFTLPSHAKIILILFAVCVFGGILATFPMNPSFHGLTLGLFFGITFALITVSTDFLIHYGSMKTDPIFNLRRCSALSLFSCLFWFAFTFLGGVLSVFLMNSNVWAKFFLIGFFAALILRLLVFSTVSFAGSERILASSLLQPILCSVSLLLMDKVIGHSPTARFLFLFLFSIVLAVLAVSLFIIFVNRVGEKKLGIGSLPIFKAFLANWAEDLNAPLESILERFGRERSVRLSILAFKAGEKIKAVVVVPAIHPGPFKNVGSSPLPYMIQSALENKLGCIVSVTHGVSGHELDLASQLENQRVIKGILESVDFSTLGSEATPFIRTQVKGAKASCQTFGKCAFITLTVAPQTMEDLSRELELAVAKEAKKRDLSPAIIVDAHNSIKCPFDPRGTIEPLEKAAVKGIEQALLHQGSSFEVGAAKVVPKEFALKDGMGPGGITVLVLKVGKQETAYITIDGNNMVSGLREKILLALREIGIADGEVLTTDTHAVNGIILTERGYHPLGEAIDQTKLIDYIKQAAKTALNNLEPAEASWRTITIPKVRIIGEEQVEALCVIAEETAQLSKKLAFSIFSMAGVLLIALLTFF